MVEALAAEADIIASACIFELKRSTTVETNCSKVGHALIKGIVLKLYERDISINRSSGRL